MKHNPLVLATFESFCFCRYICIITSCHKEEELNTELSLLYADSLEADSSKLRAAVVHTLQYVA